MEQIKDHIKQNADKYTKVFRYLFSGGTAAFVDLFLLHIFVEYLHIWYLFSAIIAYLLAFFVSFILQKYWTFQETTRENIHKQMVWHFCLGLINLSINTVMLYVLVDFVGLHYMFAQILISGILATGSFFVYKFFIFKKNV